MQGGKRIRPILSKAVLEMLHKDPADYKEFLCAMECIHTYSLVHDDLPAMDNDDYRWGKHTNHKVFWTRCCGTYRRRNVNISI